MIFERRVSRVGREATAPLTHQGVDTPRQAVSSFGRLATSQIHTTLRPAIAVSNPSFRMYAGGNAGSFGGAR